MSIEDFGGKAAYYDFSTEPVFQEPRGSPSKQAKTKVTYEKPSYLASLVKDPPKFMIQDLKPAQSLPLTPLDARSQQDFRPLSQPTHSVSETPKMIVPQKEFKQPVAAKPEITKADLLSLKKQVMEEVRKEFEEKARED